MAQQVKDPASSLQQPGWLPQCGFNPRPGNFHMPQVQMNKKNFKPECIKLSWLGGWGGRC